MSESLVNINNNIVNSNSTNKNYNINAVGNYNIIINSHVVYIIVYILLLLTIIFIYYGIAEEQKNYVKLYKPTIGKICGVELEESTNTILSNLTYGIRNYSSTVLYRIRVKYEYKVGNKTHTGYFYNNSKHDKYEELNKVKAYWARYKLNPYVKIYYSKLDNSISNIDLSKSKKINVNFYYNFSLIALFLLIAYIIFSVFCIFV